MTGEGGTPATRRLISERLRGRLSGSVFINSRDSFSPCGWWGRGGLRGVPYPALLSVFPNDFDFSMIVRSAKRLRETSFFEFFPNRVFRG